MPTKSKAAKKKTVKFYVDCWQPVEDSVLDVATFEKFLRDTISPTTATWATRPSARRRRRSSSRRRRRHRGYLKYLTKKYLKKAARDYLHAAATRCRTRCATSASTPRATTRRKNCYRSEFVHRRSTSAISTCGGAVSIYRAASTTSRASKASAAAYTRSEAAFPFFAA